jgi:hypothetical protein
MTNISSTLLPTHTLNMLYSFSILILLLLPLTHLAHAHTSTKNNLKDDPIPFETRAYWMRRANAALAELDSPCPFAAFGTVIVNHTDTSSNPHGKLVCMDINQSQQTGNPTLHGRFISRYLARKRNRGVRMRG